MKKKTISESCFIEDYWKGPSPKRTAVLRCSKRRASPYHPLIPQHSLPSDWDPTGLHPFRTPFSLPAWYIATSENPEGAGRRKQRMVNHSWTPKHKPHIIIILGSTVLEEYKFIYKRGHKVDILNYVTRRS